MELFGFCAFGIVMGWLAVLIHRPAGTGSTKAVWQRVSLLLFGGICSSTLVWFFGGFQGAVVTGLGMAFGSFAALGLMGRAHHA
jgi:hypothetical protein